MFSIVCKSCAAKLKVRNHALINQVLACPKCGEMIRIVAPEGYVPPPDRPDSGSGQSVSSDLPSGLSDFDDVDQLVGKVEPSEKRMSSTKGAKSQRATKGPQTGRPVTKTPVAVDSGIPVSPLAMPKSRAEANRQYLKSNAAGGGSAKEKNAAPEQLAVTESARWISDSARRKRLWLIAAILGVFAIGGSLAWYFGGSGKNEDREIAIRDSDSRESEVESGEVGESEPGPIHLEEKGTDQSERGVPDPEGVGEVLKNPDLEKSTSNLTDDSDSPPVVKELESPDVEVPETEKLPVSENQTGPGQAELVLPEDPLSRYQLSTKGPETRLLIDGSVSEPSEVQRLSATLLAAGTSLSEIQQIARQAWKREYAGVPQFIGQPATIKRVESGKLMEGLDFRISRLTYDSVSLLSLVRDMSMFSGVPVAWDIRAILDAGTDIRKNSRYEFSDVTVGEVMDRVMAEAGLQVIKADWGLGIFTGEGQKTATVELLAPSTEIPDRGDFLASQIPLLVAPGSWRTGEDSPGQGTIERNGPILSITNSNRTVNQVIRLVEQLNQAISTKERIPFSRPEQAERVLFVPISITPDIEMPIEQFLARVEIEIARQTGTMVTILVDWSVVSQGGWLPANTTIPGYLSAKNLQELLDAIARGLNLDWHAVDASTFLITTTGAAQQISDTGVYSLEGIVDGGISVDIVFQTLGQSIGLALPSDVYTQVCFDAGSKSMIVTAPPPVQRQVAAVMKRLREVTAARSGVSEEPIAGN